MRKTADREMVDKAFLCVRIHGADLLKSTLAESDWARHFGAFVALVSEVLHRHNGEVVRSLGDGAMAAFDLMEEAVQSAIDLQETLNSAPHVNRGLSGKIGIASGASTALFLGARPIDYLGPPVDIADRLCDRAHGNAILLHYPYTEPADALSIHSQAGLQQKRPPEGYFFEQPPCQVRGVRAAIHGYSVFWQALPGNYLTSEPAGVCRPVAEGGTEQETTYFGKVTAFKQERGFGFIQYYTEDHVYREIYFHMTYVVGQAPIQENDHVQFVIKPGKEGRPQACSVLVMGSRLSGQLDSLDASTGSGHISIRNQASEVIRFFVLPQAMQGAPLKENDLVDFTVVSGSDAEGLVATDMRLRRDETAEPDTTGDNLPLGATEQAVVTVYFIEKGYGFAKCRRNNIYVHVSELTNPEQIPGPGDLIEFDVAPGRDSTYRACNIRIIQKKGGA